MSSVFETQPMDSCAALQSDVGTTFHDAVRVEYIVFLEECQDWACMYDPQLKEVLESLEFSLRDSDAETIEMDLSSPEGSNQETLDASLDENYTSSRSEALYHQNNLSKLTRPVLASAMKYAHFLVHVSNQDDFVEQMKAKVPKCPEWALRKIFEELPPSFKINRKDRKNKRHLE